MKKVAIMRRNCFCLELFAVGFSSAFSSKISTRSSKLSWETLLVVFGCVRVQGDISVRGDRRFVSANIDHIDECIECVSIALSRALL